MTRVFGAVGSASVASALGISADGAGNLGVASLRTLVLGSGLSGGGLSSQSSGVPTTPAGVNPALGDNNWRTEGLIGALYACTVGGASPTWTPMLGIGGSVLVNAAVGFTGSLARLQLNSIDVFTVDQTGLILVPAGGALDTRTGGALLLGTVTATSVQVGPNGLKIDSAGHLISLSSGTPATSNLGANVTSATFSGNDVRGTIAIVMSGGLAANTRACTVTFANSYGATPPKVTLVDQTSAVGLTIVNSYVLSQSTGVSFDIAFDQALTAGTYTIDYLVIG